MMGCAVAGLIRGISHPLRVATSMLITAKARGVRLRYPNGRPAVSRVKKSIGQAGRACRSAPTRRRPNPRLIKIHRSYSIDEAARLLRAHKNTIRTWIKQGLPIIDRRRPTLIHGIDLSEFLKNRRKRAKRPCPPGYMHCLKCRSSQKPAAGLADYLPITATSGNLRGLCPHCGTLMHRRVAFAKLAIFGANLEIAFPQAVPRIRESTAPSVNSDSNGDYRAYEDAQC
jgi:excisionase family DNA binding protein